MSEFTRPTRRRTLQGAGILAATTLAALAAPDLAQGHEGHDHAPKTILDLKGKRVRVLGPDAEPGVFVEDRVTIRVDGEGRIVDLVYG